MQLFFYGHNERACVFFSVSTTAMIYLSFNYASLACMYSLFAVIGYRRSRGIQPMGRPGTTRGSYG